MGLFDILDAIEALNFSNETQNETVFSILQTLHLFDPTQYSADEAFSVYKSLDYAITSNHFNDIWDRFFSGDGTDTPVEPLPSVIQLFNPDDAIPIGALPKSSYPIPLDARVLYEITCYNKETKEYYTYNKIIDFREGDSLNDTDELLREELELSPCDEVEVTLKSGWSAPSE